ncbi:BTAD domain-containing putative transcriptional regulator [Streptomyces nondiastaticus]|uniref:BTAD domain-containing putative transcriptional regulator n=1 Tax=Streptomyces nondiastaticus TaxID=3154512 RepID=A0ABW6U415_9ACTN
MPIITTTGRQAAATTLGRQERDILYAVGCGLRDDEIAATLALPEEAVAGHLARILAALGLRDRAAAIVHAFDCGLVSPGRGPRRKSPGPSPRAAARNTSGPRVRISVLGPLRAWYDGQPLDLGHLRQQAVLAALALCPGRSVSRQELTDGVWGEEPPNTNVVPVYIYRLRKILHAAGVPDSVIERDRSGYRLLPGAVTVDLSQMEGLVAAAGAAERAGDLAEAVRACSQALEHFRGEPLAGQPGPFAELERLRLSERRIVLVQRKLDWQLRLGRHSEAIVELSALTVAQPLNEPVAAMLMRALYLSGRQADALAVYDRARRSLADELGVSPGRLLQQVHRTILSGDDIRPGLTGTTR